MNTGNYNYRYDQRQLKLMALKILEYKQGLISLKVLIDDLRSLLGCLKSISIEWRERFYNEWFVLEEIYAVTLYRQESLSNYVGEIQEVIKKLKYQIQELSQNDSDDLFNE